MCENEGGNDLYEVALEVVSGQALFQGEARGEGQDLRAKEAMNHHEMRQLSTNLPFNPQAKSPPSSFADTECKLH